MRTRDKFEKLSKSIPEGVIEGNTKILIDDYGKFYREFADVQELEFDSFWLWFSNFAHAKLSDERKELYKSLLRQAMEPLPPGVEAGIHERLIAGELASSAMKAIEAYGNGEEVDIGRALRGMVDHWELDTERKVKTPWVNDSIEDMLVEDADDKGFKWRLQALNNSMRPMRAGDFTIIAARPDVGKTTFLTDNVAHFAPQLDEIYPDEGREILWFNNEGMGKRILKRLYQSALNATISDLVARSEAGTVKREFIQAMGGRPNAVRIFDIHDFWNHEVEDIVRGGAKPGLIIFDMIDNIKFGGALGNNGQRTDQLLEAMYQWARVLGVRYDCPILATSQVSADGEGLCYPLQGMLKDSKTGKQGAADAIVTIGYKKDFPNSRYLGTTKNKLAREGFSKSPQQEVVFDGNRGRYVMPKVYNNANDAPPGDDGVAGDDPMEA